MNTYKLRAGRIFDTLLADRMPKSKVIFLATHEYCSRPTLVYFNFKQHQVSPAAYLPEWVLPAFLDHLPLEACARVWGRTRSRRRFVPLQSSTGGPCFAGVKAILS